MGLALTTWSADGQMPNSPLPNNPVAVACGLRACPPSDPLQRDGFVLRLSATSHFDYASMMAPIVAATGASRPPGDELITLNSTGANHTYEGRYAAGREAFERALRLSSDGRDPQVEAAALSNLGVVAAAQGRYDEARGRMQAGLDAYLALEKAPTVPAAGAASMQPLPSWMSRLGVDLDAVKRNGLAQMDGVRTQMERRIAHAGALRALLNQGNLAAHLGQYAQAEARFKEALDLVSKEPAQPGARVTHGELYAFYRKVGKADLAADQLRRAQAIPATPDSYEVGAISLGGARASQAAGVASEPAGAISAETLDKRPSHYAEVAQKRLIAEAAERERAGDTRGAAERYSRATLLAATLDSPERERGSLVAMQRIATSEGRQAEAIFFGKRAVNAVQRMRQSLGELDRQARQSFLADKKRTYTALAQLLLDANRLAEAEQVLRLLKEDEGQQFLRTTAGAQRGTIAYSLAETAALAPYERLAAQTRALEEERGGMRRGTLTAGQPDTQAAMEQARRDALTGAERLVSMFEKLPGVPSEEARRAAMKAPIPTEPGIGITMYPPGESAATREARSRETLAKQGERVARAFAIAAKPAASRTQEEAKALREYATSIRFVQRQIVLTGAGLRAFARDAPGFVNPVSAPEAAQVASLQARLAQVLVRFEPYAVIVRDVPEVPTSALTPQMSAFFAAAFGTIDPTIGRLWGIDREIEELDAERARLDAGLAAALSQPAKAAFSSADIASLDAGRRLFESLPAGTVALYYLAGEQRLDILVVDRNGRRARRTATTQAELDQRIKAYRQVLQNARLDAVAPARELYDLLVAPVADALREVKAGTLMLALDGQLRYLPFAALHDGQGWLAERYAIDLYTTATPTALTATPAPKWRVAAFGNSAGGAGFAPLQGVKFELEGIVRDPSMHTEGVLPGVIRLDRQFTAAALRAALRERQNVVHIASHFAFREDDPAASFLLLGDGNRLSLAQLNGADYRFDRVDLVTLSACETGISGDDSFGQEVEGLGTLLQGQGAAAVLATLWRVEDSSTAQFMRTLYAVRERRALSRAQAVREAQLSLIRGGAATATEGDQRGASRPGAVAVDTATLDPARPFAHPYYWAPFVLMGNWL